MQDKNLRNAYIALIAICIIWGTTFFAMKVGVRHYPPLLLLALRYCLAGVILWIIAKSLKIPHPSLADFKHISIIGFLVVLLPATLAPLQLKNLPSGLLALINAFVPVSVVLINLLFRKGADLNLLIIVGILFGLSGMFFLYNDNIQEFNNSNYALGFIFAFIGAFSAAGGLVYSAVKSNTFHPIYSAAYQYLLASVPIFISSFIFEDMGQLKMMSESTIALLYATIMGSVIGLPSYLYASTKLPTTLVSVYAYVNPLIALAIGAFFLHERVDQNIFIAAGCILCGIYIINKGKKVN